MFILKGHGFKTDITPSCGHQIISLSFTPSFAGNAKKKQEIANNTTVKLI